MLVLHCAERYNICTEHIINNKEVIVWQKRHSSTAYIPPRLKRS